jgi:uncharacterized protein (DUF1330 family)
MAVERYITPVSNVNHPIWPEQETLMTAYMIVHMNVTDMEQYREYTKLTPAIIEKFGGQFIVRGGDVITLEGQPESRRIVVVQFPSVEMATNFYNSDEYQSAIKVREGAATGQFIVVPGIA